MGIVVGGTQPAGIVSPLDTAMIAKKPVLVEADGGESLAVCNRCLKRPVDQAAHCPSCLEELGRLAAAKLLVSRERGAVRRAVFELKQVIEQMTRIGSTVPIRWIRLVKAAGEKRGGENHDRLVE